MKLLKNSITLLVAITLSIPLGSYFGNIYANLFNAHGAFVDVATVLGFPFGYEFLVPFLFVVFGNKESRWWWIGISLTPAAIFELFIDPWHIYIPILLVLCGWLIGWGINKLIKISSSRT